MDGSFRGAIFGDVIFLIMMIGQRKQNLFWLDRLNYKKAEAEEDNKIRNSVMSAGRACTTNIFLLAVSAP